jgi:hypothetical protein
MAIRRRCLDCCGNQPAEVRRCEAVSCALWPFRSGMHPYTRTRLQEADFGERPVEGVQVPDKRASRETGLQRGDFGCKIACKAGPLSGDFRDQSWV